MSIRFSVRQPVRYASSLSDLQRSGIYPRLLFVVPFAILILTVVVTNSTATTKERQPQIPAAVVSDPGHDIPRPGQPTAGIHAIPVRPDADEKKDKEYVDYQVNIQGIQNLMGFLSDLNDTCAPYIPFFTYSSSSQYSPASTLLVLVCLLMGPTALVVTHPAFPARYVALFGGILPWTALHPDVQAYLERAPLRTQAEAFLRQITSAASDTSSPYIIRKFFKLVNHMFSGNVPHTLERLSSTAVMKMTRILDDDHLEDRCWASEMREVELFENERFYGSPPGDAHRVAGWAKVNLHTTERGPWTRGRDGWSSVGDAQGHVRCVPPIGLVNLHDSISPTAVTSRFLCPLGGLL